MTKPAPIRSRKAHMQGLQATVCEQEATILRLRGENSVLLAKLAAMRKRKPKWKARKRRSAFALTQLTIDRASHG